MPTTILLAAGTKAAATTPQPEPGGRLGLIEQAIDQFADDVPPAGDSFDSPSSDCASYEQ